VIELRHAFESWHERYGWYQVIQDSSRAYVEGYAEGHVRALGVRPPFRVVDRTPRMGPAPKVISEWPAITTAPLGAGAGLPRPGDYLRAAAEVLNVASGNVDDTARGQLAEVVARLEVLRAEFEALRMGETLEGRGGGRG
jgi:hypothetical protein